MQKISKNQIALAGEFAVLSQLSLHGFDANLTLGNTKGVDILVSNPETGSMKRLEVKTHTHNKDKISNEVNDNKVSDNQVSDNKINDSSGNDSVNNNVEVENDKAWTPFQGFLFNKS